MSTATSPTSIGPNLVQLPDHLVLYDVDWAFYESLLEQIGDRPLRVTYNQGELEIMSPLAEHELRSRFIGKMIEMISVDFAIPIVSYGSTTFRKEGDRVGLEPDECYFVQNEAKARTAESVGSMPPDLAVEVDVTHRSVERMPVYARLGVGEIWRHDGVALAGLRLDGKAYQPIEMSLAFPFLRVADLNPFIRMADEQGQYPAIVAFREWLKTLKR